MSGDREKSCGAVLYRLTPQGTREYLGVLNLSHRHWGFPKGHMEPCETEEQTARREVLEETGMTFSFIEGFRHVVNYIMPSGISKQVVYFLGRAHARQPVAQQTEIAVLGWMSVQELLDKMGFENDRRTLVKADAFLSGR